MGAFYGKRIRSGKMTLEEVPLYWRAAAEKWLRNKMNTEIIVALIASAGGILGAFVGVIASAQLTTYRIQQLEKKVEKHNTVIERTYKLEENQAVMEEQIKVANHRIADLENGKEG